MPARLSSPRSPASLSSSVPFGSVRRIHHARAVLPEAVDLAHLVIGQGKIEDREIGGEMLGVGSARDRDDALLHEVAQRDLRRALANPEDRKSTRLNSS